MKFHPDSIDAVVDLLEHNQLTYGCSVIIGDNSSGKSMLVKQLIEKRKDKNSIYFIDAVNRGFDVTKVSKNTEKPPFKGTILKTRLNESYFNIQDSFNCYGTLTERIEQIYTVFEKEVQRLFQELVNDEFEILYGNLVGEVQFKEGRGLLSSGYQAIIRLLLELTYYNEMCQGETSDICVVIDELDEFLSPRYAAKILGFLRQKFQRFEFVITTHSIDLVIAAQDANIVILDTNGYEIIDANDYNSYTEVQRLFQRVFGKQEVDIADVEDILRRLLNNKINGAWSEVDERKMQELQKETLSASQRLVYRQIMEAVR